MKKIALLIFCIALAGCELFVLGGGRRSVVLPDADQKTPQGVVYLFKAELDSNNIPAAAHIMAKPGRQMIAIEKYEMYDELERLTRVLAKKPITRIEADSGLGNLQKLKVEFDYITYMNITTQRIDDAWYITSVVPL